MAGSGMCGGILTVASLIPTEVVVDHRPRTAEELVKAINGFVEGELVGREWIPADVSELFAPLLEELRESYAGLRGERRKHTRTKFRLWVDMLTTSSMVPEEGNARDRLFVSHSFSCCLGTGRNSRTQRAELAAGM